MSLPDILPCAHFRNVSIIGSETSTVLSLIGHRGLVENDIVDVASLSFHTKLAIRFCVRTRENRFQSGQVQGDSLIILGIKTYPKK